MKKILLLTLLVCQTVAIMAADNWVKVGNLWYWYNDAKTTAAVVPARNSETYTGLSDEITIPASIDVDETPIPVTEIRANTFQGCTNITSVVINAAITQILSNCFKGCSGLTSINIPATVTKINSSAFQDCTSLGVVNIPNGVTTIYGSAFAGCSGMTEINIPASVTSIGGNAFTGCTSLEKVNFASVPALCNISFNNTYSNPLLNANAQLWIDGVEQTNLVIPSGITTIKKYAFAGLKSVSSVDFSVATLPLTIEEDAFINNSGYDKVVYKDAEQLCSIDYEKWTSNPLYYGNHIYYQGSNAEVTIVDIPASSLNEAEIRRYILAGANSITRIEIPSGATTIGAGAFKGCGNFEFVAFTSPEDFQTIRWYDDDANPFANGTAKPLVNSAPLESLTLNTNVTAGKYKNSTWLKNVTLTNGVTTIGAEAFMGCTNLTSVTFSGAEITSIGSRAFRSCWSLGKITLPESVTSIGEEAFRDCKSTSFTEITIPSKCTSLGQGAFVWCVKLKTVTIESNIDIPELCFQNCGNLEKVITTTTKNIGNSAFYNCANLTEVPVTDGLTTIGNYAFSGCKKLTNLMLSERGELATIGEGAFNGCTGVTMVSLPASIGTINANAFSGCTALADVYCLKETTPVPVVYVTSFGGRENEINLHVTNTGDYLSADNWKNFQIVARKDVTLTFFVNDEPYGTPITHEAGTRITESEPTFDLVDDGTTKEEFSGWDKPFPETMPSDDTNFYGYVSTTTTIGDYKYKFSPAESLNGKGLTKRVSLIGVVDNIITQSNSKVTVPLTVTNTNGNYNKSEFPVIAIGAEAFKGQGELAEIILTTNIEELGESAFLNCSKLESVKGLAGSKVTAFSKNLFQNCTSLSFEEIPGNIKAIGNLALSNTGCSAVTIHSSIESMGTEVFKECRSLETVVFADGFNLALPELTFKNCSALKNVTLKGTMGAIGISAFEGCGAMTGIVVPEGIDRIGRLSFNGCIQLTNLSLPSTISQINERAFQGCKNLSQIAVESENVPTAYSNAFETTTYQNAKVYVNDVNKFETADTWKNFHNFYTNNTYRLTYKYDGEQYGEIDNLKVGQAIVPREKPTKEGHDFQGWEGLYDVMPDRDIEVTGKFQYQLTYELAEGTLEDNTKLLYYGDKIVIPVDALKKDDNKFTVTFKMTDNPKEDIPVTQDEAAEANISMPAKNLTAIVSYKLSEKEVTIGSLKYKVYLLENERRAEVMVSPDASGNVDIPPTINVDVSEDPLTPNLQDIPVTAIQDNAFDGKQTITGMTLPEGIVSIGKRAFYDNRFTTFTVPASVTTIGSEAFRCCRTMQTLTFADNSPITVLPFGVYQDCSALKNVVLPDQLQRIEENGFNNCIQLEKVTLPATLTFLGARAFAGCSALTQITANPTTAPTTANSSNVFDAIYTTATLYVKDGSSGYNQAPWLSFTHGVLKEYTLTYQWDDEEAQTKQVMVGDRIDLPTPTGEKYENRDFFGWQGLPEVMPAEDVEVTSKFKYKLSYEIAEESAEESKAFSLPDDAWYWYGDPIQLSNELNHENYSFTTTGMPGDNKMPSDDVKIIVKYSRSEETTTKDNINYKVVLLEVDGEPAHAEVMNSPGATGIVEIPDNITYNENTYPVTVIQDNAFNSSNSRQVTGMTLPSNLKRIGALAFRDCRFETLTIPATVESIGSQAFLYCTKIQTITFSGTALTELSAGVFQSCTSLESIELPEGLTTIGISAFAGCNALTAVKFPSTIDNIGDYAFSGSTAIETVTATSTNLPTATSTIFDDKVYDNALLKVLTGTTHDDDPWNLFDKVQEGEDGGSGTDKCATPTIKYDKGTLKFECTDEGATIVSDIKDEDITKDTNASPSTKALTKKYTITAYAKKSGMLWSDEVTATITWRNGKPEFEGFTDVKLEKQDPTKGDGDVNGDGHVNGFDAIMIMEVEVGQRSSY